MRTICLYCGARHGADPMYTAAAEELGIALASRGWRLVYGGGSIGLMGDAARAALEHGGEVVGVIPRNLVEREQGLATVTELVVTETLRERKAIMFERSDAFVALPGGFGTLEEVLETLTLRQLRYHNKPIYFLNVGAFYEPLFAFFHHVNRTQFIQPSHFDLFEVCPDVPSLMDRLANI
ncbi:TIGR00730 family Rossman fold protein [Candidatus Viridilinea mediisalina]|uniref:Cytokinin riboside 5'-monophosphate phosphoribohydrolase n=1 Tax=Candidatus Viridilinea mediisalina TaxID=2024553 RepID=A0A2A6RJW5_9CHLR|nr:TIGR00730 family Rossman fold protein [Candidatus Viridilinea mediisalina]PDW03179.1 TIGR00730 family Rossman fold protein [Candidatus Viridilinea mediisalina]